MLMPFSGMQSMFVKAYLRESVYLFTNVGKSGYVDFKIVSAHPNLIHISRANTLQMDFNGSVKAMSNDVDVKLIAFFPFVLLVSFFMATPIKLKYRLMLLLPGLFLLNIYLMGSLYVIIIHGFSQTSWLQLFQFKNMSTIDFINNMVENNSGISIFLVIIIWSTLLLVFQPEIRNTFSK